MFREYVNGIFFKPSYTTVRSEANLLGTKEVRAKTRWLGVGILCPNAEVGLSLCYSFRELNNINHQFSLLTYSCRYNNHRME